jgi:hypothetical protein
VRPLTSETAITTYCRKNVTLLLHFLVKRRRAVRVEFVGAQIAVQRLESGVGRQDCWIDWRKHDVLSCVVSLKTRSCGSLSVGRAIRLGTCS